MRKRHAVTTTEILEKVKAFEKFYVYFSSKYVNFCLYLGIASIRVLKIN